MKKGYLVVAVFILAIGIAAALYFNDFEYALGQLLIFMMAALP